jgi:hypothetical protein
MHLAWRWFTGFGFDQEIPHHSAFMLADEKPFCGATVSTPTPDFDSCV